MLLLLFKYPSKHPLFRDHLSRKIWKILDLKKNFSFSKLVSMNFKNGIYHQHGKIEIEIWHIFSFNFGPEQIIWDLISWFFFLNNNSTSIRSANKVWEKNGAEEHSTVSNIRQWHFLWSTPAVKKLAEEAIYSQHRQWIVGFSFLIKNSISQKQGANICTTQHNTKKNLIGYVFLHVQNNNSIFFLHDCKKSSFINF
jgi:hypothetical protein